VSQPRIYVSENGKGEGVYCVIRQDGLRKIRYEVIRALVTNIESLQQKFYAATYRTCHKTTAIFCKLY